MLRQFRTSTVCGHKPIAMLGVISSLVSFVAAYTCLDAVVVDFDSDDAIPPRLKTADDVDSKLLAEFMDLLGDSSWKSLQKLASKNISIEWVHSKAYKRDLYLLTCYLNFPRDDVLDALWLEEFTHSSWNHQTFEDSKALEYAGDNRIVLWQKVRPPRGQEAFISPRDGLGYFRKISVLESEHQDFGLPNSVYRNIFEEYDTAVNNASSAQTKTSLLLASNATAFGFHIPEAADTVRGQAGTCGILLTDYPATASPTGTKIMWIVNGDSFPPTFIPNAIVRRIMAKTMTGIIDSLKKVLGSQRQGRR